MSTDTTYKDPENVKEIIEGLSDVKSIRDVIEYINTIFPTWIIGFSDGYSPSYPSLTKNWHELCKNIDVKPTAVIIIDYMVFTTDYTLIQTFGELFTRAGFSVRDKYQLESCVKCKMVYPTDTLHAMLKDKNEQVPEIRGCC